MMLHPKGKLRKVLAISSFLLLVSGLVAYKAGAMDHLFHNGKKNMGAAAPTDPPKQTMSSSKSLIITEGTTPTTDTTAKKATVRDSGLKTAPQEMLIMGSSKSGRVFAPADTVKKNPK